MSTLSESSFAEFNQNLIAEFRANDGKLEGPMGRAPLLLLTTKGAKSGRAHTTPLAYCRDGDRLVVIASMGGAPTNPAWYHNLVASPAVTVELPGETMTATATVADGAERQRLWDAQVAVIPNFDDYQQRATRTIPVIVLEPVR